MRMIWLLAVALLPLGSGSAETAAPDALAPVMIGVDRSTPGDQAAYLFFNQPTRETVKTSLSAIAAKPRGEPRGEAVGIERRTLAVVAAGRYVLYGSCATAFFDTTITSTVELEGGKRYHARCVGRSSSKVRLEVSEIGATP